MKIATFPDIHANLFEYDVEKVTNAVEKSALPNSLEETLRIAK